MANQPFTPEQIAQILDEFFKAVGTRQYIGARYLPLFGRKGEDSMAWDNTAPYEALTVVTYGGNSYVAKRPVPADVPISDTTYWALTANFNAQVEQYRRDTARAIEDTENLRNDFDAILPSSDFDSTNSVKSYIDNNISNVSGAVAQETANRESAIQHLSENVSDEYVPFPTVYSKYGVIGQVLSTLANGSTQWVDPAIPTDEQAAQGISNWLTQHPEATTTVEDGSISDAKISPTSGVFRTFSNNYHANLDDALEVNKAFLVTNGTNLPASETQGLLIVLGAPANLGGGVLQIFMNPSLKIYLRRKWGNNPWSIWDKANLFTNDLFTTLNTSSNYFRRNTSNATITDLNDASANTIEQFVTVSGVSNVPVPEIGLCLTFAGSGDAGKLQLYMTLSRKLFFRHCWGGTWGAWTQLTTPELLNNGIYMRTNQANGGITDLNNAASNVIYQFVSVAGVSNLPIEQIGICYTVDGWNSAGRVQYYYTPASARAYYRIFWGSSWSAWNRIANESFVSEAVSNATSDLLMTFSNITCCGDSLTWSQVYTGETTSRQAYNSYPAVLTRLTRVTAATLATPGYSTIDWWNRYASNIESKANQLAIIYLGTNGGLTDTIDTDCPAGTPSSDWANTNTGCYGKIIDAFKNVGAKVLLVKCYSSSGTGSANLAVTNSVIDKFGTRFDCAVIDNERLSSDAYHYWPNRQGTNYVHYNDIGYAAFANYLVAQVSGLSAEQLSRLIPE